MRLKFISSLLTSAFLAFAGSVAAQTPAASEPAPPQTQEQAQSPNLRDHASRADAARYEGRVVMGMGSPRGREEHSGDWAGPLRAFSRMEAGLDNPMVRAALGLTDQQAGDLRKIIVNSEIFTIQTGASAAVDAIQLKELLRADHPDHAAVMAKGDALSQSASALIHHYLDAILSAKAILTPEQQKMIRAYMENGGRGLHLPR